jgi:hypothetical protein
MNTAELYIKLKDAYSGQNLHRITVTLINLYKDQQFGTLRQITEMINESVEIPIDEQARYFSKLMMLYHPDRGDIHRNEIDRLAAEQDHEGLLGYAHILLLNRIEEIATNLSSIEDIDYSPVYEWDVNLEGFTIVQDKDTLQPEKKQFTGKHRRGYTFYEAVKMRMYGKTSVGFPPHYFEDLDEFEMAVSDINDLDGVQYCIHATSLDLSGNDIQDISPLWGLTQLEELNLSDNRIREADTLANLRNLKTLDLSNNGIRDISPLMNLGKLEYVDLSGCKVSALQIKQLEEMGVTVAL